MGERSESLGLRLALLALAAVVAATGAFLYLRTVPVEHQARARLLVGTLTADINTIRAAEALATTYVELAGTESLLRDAISRGQLDMSTSELRRALNVVTVGSTRVILVTVQHGDPVSAGIAASAVSEALRNFDEESLQNLTVLDTGSDAVSLPARMSALVLLAGFGGAGLAFGLLTLRARNGRPAEH